MSKKRLLRRALLKSGLFSVISAIFGQVNGVMNPRDNPYVHWKAMLKVGGL